MLVITRKVGESVRIGDAEVVILRATDRDRVRLGITAPKQIEIVRSEIDRREKERPE